MRLTKVICAAAAVTGALSGAAHAASVFDFTYTFADGGVLSGVLDGSATANGFTVTSLASLTFNGHDADNDLTGPAAGVESYDAVNVEEQGLNGDGTPVVRTDGSYLDLTVGLNLSTDLLSFSVGDAAATEHTSLIAFISGAYMDGDIPFVVSRWSAQIVPSAPEPAGWSLTLIGLGGAGAALRRRPARAAA